MTTTKLPLVLLVLLLGCNSETKKENELLKAETQRLQQENEAYRTNNVQLNATIDSYEKTLKEIDDNLKAVDINATMVGTIGGDNNGNEDVRENIFARIASIKALLDNSKLKILALDKNLRELRLAYGEQSEEVQALTREIKEQARIILEKETEYRVMAAEYEDDIEMLQASYDQQVLMTQQLSEILNRAYYFAGTSRELKDKGIVDTEGGFIGLGRVKVLNASSSDGLFNQIRKDATDALTFEGKSLELVTQHADGSYRIEKVGESMKLTILNKTEFWKTGNYLVIETK
jgi:chromosome segregation ATPase